MRNLPIKNKPINHSIYLIFCLIEAGTSLWFDDRDKANKFRNKNKKYWSKPIKYTIDF
jgi:hypothetical protein